MSKPKEQPSLSNGVYRHNKSGRLYRVIGLALETKHEREWLVVYEPLYDSDVALFARPYHDFTELVEVHGRTLPRFEPIDTPRTFLA